MRYRVQYVADNQRRSVEVEAGSPQEAVIRFRHISTECDRDRAEGSRVLSVWAEPDLSDLP
ncbi:MAG: hypothetical protein AMJ81_00975 [Phycisphaerae bacterium SM23_33]|jgi:hypothetical protein|nr:MAG: hypothetical protein AMJ81_00975 [Phycisphaerae bacterium SM23_33]